MFTEANIKQIAKLAQDDLRRVYQDYGWSYCPTISTGLVHLVLKAANTVQNNLTHNQPPVNHVDD